MEVRVQTSHRRSAGTPGRAAITLRGANGNVGPVVVHGMIDGATSLDRGSLVVFLVTMPAGPARDRDDLVLEMELSLLDPAKAKSWLPERVTVEHVRTQRVWRFDTGVVEGGWLTSKEPAMVYHPDSVVQPDPAFVVGNVGGEGKGNDGDSSDDYPEKNDDGDGGLPLSLLAACEGGEADGGEGKGGEEEKPLTIDDALVGQRVEVYWPKDSK